MEYYIEYIDEDDGFKGYCIFDTQENFIIALNTKKEAQKYINEELD